MRFSGIQCMKVCIVVYPCQYVKYRKAYFYIPARAIYYTTQTGRSKQRMKTKTFEEFQEETRVCFDCRKPFKVKDLVMNIDIHYHCKNCADKFYNVKWVKL